MLEGGNRIVEQLVRSTIYGPAFNATIEGGHAAPIVVNSATDAGSRSQVAFIYAYGHADGGSPFYIQEVGIRTSSTGLGQNTRLIVDVGGKYRSIQGIYVLGQLRLNEERTRGSGGVLWCVSACIAEKECLGRSRAGSRLQDGQSLCIGAWP